MQSKQQPQQPDTLFSMYCFDPDNGELVLVKRNIEKDLARAMAYDTHSYDKFAVKLVDQFDSAVVMTLG